MSLITLPTPPDFHFDAAVHSHGWYILKPHTWDDATQTLGYTLTIADGTIWTLAITMGVGALNVDADGGTVRLTPKRRALIESRVRWMFRLDEDYAPFYALCAVQPHLAHVEAAGIGRILRCATLWEDFARVLTTTNTTWTLTKRMVANLVDRWGAPHSANLTSGRDLRAFPTPETISAVSEDDLKLAGLGYRAGYLLHNARLIAEGKLDLESLQTSDLPDKELRAQLVSLRGAGDYAANTLMILLGRYSFVPVDTEARATISKVFFTGAKVTDKQVKETLAMFQPYPALALYSMVMNGV